MKTKMIRRITVTSIVAATMALGSCQRERLDSDFTTASNQAFADESYNDVNNIADEAALTGAVFYKTEVENSLLAGCAVVTRDTISIPHVTTIDFGSGCTGIDGKTRRGIIVVTHDGHYRQAETTVTITFNNYYVNDNQVIGTKTIHNDGVNGNGNFVFTITVNGQIILSNGGGTINWTSQRVREWIAGESTPSRDDDQYSITGLASGTAANGELFTATIVDPLIRNIAPGCRRHFVSGTVLIQRSGKSDKVIDFGSGTCDNLATVTINGVTRTITLRH